MFLAQFVLDCSERIDALLKFIELLLDGVELFV
jgi:hypothetical protein